MAKTIVDLSGNTFGKLTVIDISHKDSRRNYHYKCLCECGNLTVVSRRNLITGNTKSCGCLLREFNWTGYGEISGIYWCHVVNGCKKRGRPIELSITIKDAWEVFLSQSRKCALSGVELVFAKSYHRDNKEQTASLDRIDSSKGYITGNIQWVHKILNKIKWELGEQELFNWVAKIYRYRQLSSQDNA